MSYAFQNQMKMSLLAHGKIGLGKKSHTPCFKKNSLIPWENMRKSKSGRALVEGSLNDVQCVLHKNLWWGYRAPRAYPDCLRTLLTPSSELLPLIAGRSREDPFHEKQSNGILARRHAHGGARVPSLSALLQLPFSPGQGGGPPQSSSPRGRTIPSMRRVARTMRDAALGGCAIGGRCRGRAGDASENADDSAASVDSLSAAGVSDMLVTLSQGPAASGASFSESVA